jgi:hypothetical protein
MLQVTELAETMLTLLRCGADSGITHFVLKSIGPDILFVKMGQNANTLTMISTVISTEV